MNPTPFSIGDTVVCIRDLEGSYRGIVLGYDDRGLVLVEFEDGMPMARPVESLERLTEKKSPASPSGVQGTILAEATNLGDYLRRMAEA